jgi:hypothetical protein
MQATRQLCQLAVGTFDASGLDNLVSIRDRQHDAA